MKRIGFVLKLSLLAALFSGVNVQVESSDRGNGTHSRIRATKDTVEFYGAGGEKIKSIDLLNSKGKLNIASVSRNGNRVGIFEFNSNLNENHDCDSSFDKKESDLYLYGVHGNLLFKTREVASQTFRVSDSKPIVVETDQSVPGQFLFHHLEKGGAQPAKLLASDMAFRFVESPHGSRWAFTGGMASPELVVTDDQGGIVFSKRFEGKRGPLLAPEFSQDERWVAVVHRPGAMGGYLLILQSEDKTIEYEFPSYAGGGFGSVFSPDGRIVYHYNSNRIYGFRASDLELLWEKELEVDGKALQIVDIRLSQDQKNIAVDTYPEPMEHKSWFRSGKPVASRVISFDGDLK